MNYKDITVGTVVTSAMGRDKDTIYFVVASVSEDFVLVCDGVKRKLDNPKLKRRKHLKPCLQAKDDLGALELTQIINAKDYLALKDTDIKKLLKEINGRNANG